MEPRAVAPDAVRPRRLHDAAYDDSADVATDVTVTHADASTHLEEQSLLLCYSAGSDHGEPAFERVLRWLLRLPRQHRDIDEHKDS